MGMAEQSPDAVQYCRDEQHDVTPCHALHSHTHAHFRQNKIQLINKNSSILLYFYYLFLSSKCNTNSKIQQFCISRIFFNLVFLSKFLYLKLFLLLKKKIIMGYIVPGPAADAIGGAAQGTAAGGHGPAAERLVAGVAARLARCAVARRAHLQHAARVCSRFAWRRRVVGVGVRGEAREDEVVEGGRCWR
jgi:hypothetical protein